MALPPDPLGSIKIAKNAYAFNLRRRFTPISHFVVKKSKATSPIAQAIESIRSPPKRPFGTGAGRGGRGGASAASPPSGGIKSIISAMVKTTLLIVFLLVLAFLWFYLRANAQAGALPVPPQPIPSFSGSLDVRPLAVTILTAGTESAISGQPYVQFDYTPHNLSAFSLDVRMYSSPPSRQVFLLRYPRRGDDNWNDFSASLEANLHQRGWLMSEIDPGDLGTMPGGSTLLIPTGFLPSPLLAGDPSRRIPSISDLASRGVSIVYIGRPFDNVLDEGGSTGTPRAADPAALANLGLTFNLLSPPASSAPFRMGAPLYAVSSKLHEAKSYYGSVQALSYDTGFLIFVPQTLDGGWPKAGQTAGEDIAMLIADEPYRPVLSYASWSVNNTLPPLNGPQAVGAPPATGPAIETGRISLFLNPAVPAQIGYLRLRFYLNDSNGLGEQLVMDWPVHKQANGDLFLVGSSVLIPEYLGGGLTYVELQPHETAQGSVKLYLELEQDGQTFSRSEVEAGPTSTSVPTTATFSTDAPTGPYVLRLVDQYNKIYAATRVYVPNLAVAVAADPKTRQPYQTRTMFGSGEFDFAFYVDGVQKTVPAVNVTLLKPPSPMGGPKIEFDNTMNVSYYLKRDFGRGNYTFSFDFGHDYVQNLTLTYDVRVQFWEKPEVMAMGLFGLLIFALGFYMSKLRQEKLLFALDIPDFPPQSVIKINLPVMAVLGLFDSINRDYAWERMPLKAEELKNGFRKVMQGGKPVMIGDYNLQRLLEQLRARHLVEESGGYWMPTAWTRTSSGSTSPAAPGAPAAPARGPPPTARRLATYRYLRDLFVTHAVRFSKLRAVPNCDVKVLIGQGEYYIHFYEGDDDVILRALLTVEAGRTWILFPDSYELERFEGRLHSAGRAPLALKMQLATKRARLYTLDDLPRVLKNLKVEVG